MGDGVWKISPHTEAKHVLLKAYLDQWFPILAQSRPRSLERLIYIDGFAGPGKYKDGEPGSPVVAISAILNNRSLRTYGGVVEMVFVENDKRRFDTLSSRAPLVS